MGLYGMNEGVMDGCERYTFFSLFYFHVSLYEMWTFGAVEDKCLRRLLERVSFFG